MTASQPTSAVRRASLRSRIRSASLAVKLTLLSVGVTAIVIIGALYALSAETQRGARALLADQLRRHQTMLLALQRQNLNLLVSASAVVTQSASLRSALETYRMEESVTGSRRADLVATVERELARLLDPIDRDLLVVTDLQGNIFAAVGRDSAVPARGASFADFGAIRRALGMDAPSGDAGELAVLGEGSTTYQLAVHPLMLRGFTIGALALGERLDHGLVQSARQGFEGELIVVSGDAVIMGSATPELLGALKTEGRSPDAVPLLSVNGEKFVAAALPLGGTRAGQPVTLWLVQPLQPTVNALIRPLLRDFVWYGLIAIALAGIGAALATQSLLRPFKDFVAYLRSGAASDASQARFISAGSSTEIHTLNESFQRLMESIEAKQSELAQRTTELTAANAVLVDEIRERERMEHALGERDAQLRHSQKMEAIGTLAGGIAHDFNNLLTAVSGFTQLALMSTDPASPVAADLRQVVEAADRAGHLTKQLLAFSRKQVLQPTLLDAGEVVQTLSPMLARLIGEHITLTVDAGGTAPRVLADRGQLEQVIMNLAINARDAMPHGGRLTISVAGRVINDAKSVMLSVRDTGTGIPAELRGRIFEPFFTTKEAGKGTGLGLSTVYGIVTQSGGRVSVDSTVNVGTIFHVELPAADEDVVRVVGAPQSAEWPRGNETVLLVEDEPAVRTLARRTLEACGYTVLPAANPIEALELAKTARIDVILSDLQMPGLTGTQMVERFLVHFPAPVVVFMSGYADDMLMAETRSIRSAFLRKPFSPTALAQAVRDALDASRRTPAMVIS